jgi:hypothetical protein
VVTSQQFNRDVSAEKRAALDGPMVITSRGRTTHVLLSLEDYRSAVRAPVSLREALVAEDGIALEPASLDIRLQAPDLT